MTNTPIGRHIILDLYDVSIENLTILNSTDTTKGLWDEYINRWFTESKVTCLGQLWHDFDKSGAFTVLYLLSESHMSIHTWPERRYVAIDLFTCGDCDVVYIIEKLEEFFEPGYKKITELTRGDLQALTEIKHDDISECSREY